jgi:hypothetical protein
MIFIERKEQSFGSICSEAVSFLKEFNIRDIVSVNMLLRLANLKAIFLKTNRPNPRRKRPGQQQRFKNMSSLSDALVRAN